MRSYIWLCSYLKNLSLPCLALCGPCAWSTSTIHQEPHQPTQRLPPHPQTQFLWHITVWNSYSSFISLSEFSLGFPRLWELLHQPLWAHQGSGSVPFSVAIRFTSRFTSAVSTQIHMRKPTVSLPKGSLSCVWLSPSTQWHWIRNKETWGISSQSSG